MTEQKQNPMKDLETIFYAGLDRVNPYNLIKEQVKVENDALIIQNENNDIKVLLTNYDKVVVIGTGKAGARMGKAIEEVLGDFISVGLICVKYGHTDTLNKLRLMEAGHPIPDENSIKSAKSIESVVKDCDENTLIINMISGGGSAVLCYPYSNDDFNISLSLNEKQQTTKLLLGCGATISELNCVRKHLSLIKGGRLAEMFYPATSINLILSDVIGDKLDTISSGLTAPDNTTFTDAYNVLSKYKLLDKVPPQVLRVIELGMHKKLGETPKPDDKIFTKVTNLIVASNYQALLSASEKAKELNYNTATVSSELYGEACEIAKALYSIAKSVKKHETFIKRPAVIINGGETTVTIKGEGKGGRNQEMALAYLREMSEDTAFDGGIYFLSSATDGNDGPTDASGGFASQEVLNKASCENLSISDYLSNNDSYNFFDKLGYLLKTGVTNTNVGDIQVTIIP